MSATDKWPGFVLTKEGEEFVEQNAKLFKYDLMYNPLRFESWQRLGNIYDEVSLNAIWLIKTLILRNFHMNDVVLISLPVKHYKISYMFLGCTEPGSRFVT